MIKRRLIPMLSILLIPGLLWAAPEADLWERWQAHDPDAQLSVDHSPWTAFLETYLVQGEDGINRVDYRGVTPKDRARLDAYLETLAATEVDRISRASQLPFWINLYNALTVQVVLDHFPVDSIRDIDISPGLFSNGPWGKKLIRVEGEELSLDDVEHRILRPIWQDPRIHYAVNCAALGCPNLQPRAFTPENTEALLEKGAVDYVNHPRGVLIRDGDLGVSSIYDWFQEDFGGSEAGVIDHLLRYARPGLRERLLDFREIDDHRYDWSLNQAGGENGVRS
jgi:hypothetical protein